MENNRFVKSENIVQITFSDTTCDKSFEFILFS
jgi:hypothetical protein